ncbi:hypothetical protein HYPSUDRAFT_808993 [Hypholoma sublateritium FD-334 SS-4]|uniref:Uncharacterized protein n=1 Tax=Hypholoma sublateritium (strain FD-334 SS-4) TaxID=945553 RepID=A0A0D2LKI4_HYPSF|nr:hypothetical protein HYPSUDRAFT_808993 [Hypholoma sublateritium FD-334 SS-4]
MDYAPAAQRQHKHKHYSSVRNIYQTTVLRIASNNTINTLTFTISVNVVDSGIYPRNSESVTIKSPKISPVNDADRLAFIRCRIRPP